MNTDVEIGVADLQYDVSGKPTLATFTPALHVAPDLTKMLADLLKDSSATEIEAKDRAQVVLAEWFSHIDSIELADRETGRVESEILSCEKWDEVRPRNCRIRFFFTNQPERKEHK